MRLWRASRRAICPSRLLSSQADDSETGRFRRHLPSVGGSKDATRAWGNPPIPNTGQRDSADGRSVPMSDLSKCSEQRQAYSMTSSARVSSVGGMLRPIALADFKLITSSKRVGCSTGSSAGLAPFRILSTKTAARRYISTSAPK